MSLNAKSKGTQKDIRLMPDITTPPYVSTDGSSFNHDFLQINLAIREDTCNKPSYFSYSSGQLQSGIVRNFPTVINVGDSFIGYREVYPLTVSPTERGHVCVKITEFYPVLGREHYQFFNATTWGDWRTVNGN